MGDTAAPTESPPPLPELAPDAHKRGGVGWDVVFAILGGLLALGILQQIFYMLSGKAADAGEMSQVILILALVLQFALMGGSPFLWVAMTREGGWEGTKTYFDLRMRGSDWGWGFLLTFVFLGLAVGFTLLLAALKLDEGNSTVDGVIDLLNWPIVILIALGAGIGEELMFRGVLQKWLGWWGQAIIFGLAHAGPGQELQVLFTMLLGFIFGYARHRGVSLPALMLAHALYDFILLSLVLNFPELEGESLVWFT